jgi:hypothetical protein
MRRFLWAVALVGCKAGAAGPVAPPAAAVKLKLPFGDLAGVQTLRARFESDGYDAVGNAEHRVGVLTLKKGELARFEPEAPAPVTMWIAADATYMVVGAHCVRYDMPDGMSKTRDMEQLPSTPEQRRAIVDGAAAPMMPGYDAVVTLSPAAGAAAGHYQFADLGFDGEADLAPDGRLRKLVIQAHPGKMTITVEAVNEAVELKLPPACK